MVDRFLLLLVRSVTCGSSGFGDAIACRKTPARVPGHTKRLRGIEYPAYSPEREVATPRLRELLYIAGVPTWDSH